MVDNTHDNTEASNERVFLATMLALREVLTQNAYRIFQMEDVSRDDEQQLADDTKPGSKRQKRLDYREERQYMAQLFGTGVIIASLQSLTRVRVAHFELFGHDGLIRYS